MPINKIFFISSFHIIVSFLIFFHLPIDHENIIFFRKSFAFAEEAKNNSEPSESMGTMLDAFKDYSTALVDMHEKEDTRTAKLSKRIDNKRIKLLSWRHSDFKSAEEIILITLEATAIGKGYWWQAHGLLGASRLNDATQEKSGYRNLFKYGNLNDLKLERAAKNYSSDFFGEPEENGSWIYAREYYLAKSGYNLENCNMEAFKDMTKVAEGKVWSCSELMLDINPLKKLYDGMAKKGYYDFNLGDALGFAIATVFSIDNENQDVKKILKDWSVNDTYNLPSALQSYFVTLEGTGKLLDAGNSFYDSLKISMIENGIYTEDSVAIPYNYEFIEPLLRLVKEDFKRINEKYTEKKPKSLVDELITKWDKTLKIWNK